MEPTLVRVGGDASTSRVRAAVLVLHGGRERSTATTTARQVAVLRLVPVARRLARAVPGDVAVWRLRNRLRGWNGSATGDGSATDDGSATGDGSEVEADPVADARWALAELQRRHGPVPVVVVGHSLGGRVALRIADAPPVTAVVALAPWVKPEDPPSAVAGKRLLVVHGERDRTTDPAASRAFVETARALGADARWVGIPRSGHAMLRHLRRWNALTEAFVRDAVG